MMTPREFRAARLALGLSVEQLAERLGVDPRSVRRWQNGHGPIPGAGDHRHPALDSAVACLALTALRAAG